jgi:hypothetical protein
MEEFNMGKRLYELTVSELRAEAEHYEQAGNDTLARMCREAADLNIRISEAFNIRREAALSAAQEESDESGLKDWWNIKPGF